MKRTESRGVKIIFVKTSRDVGIVSRSSNCQVEDKSIGTRRGMP